VPSQPSKTKIRKSETALLEKLKKAFEFRPIWLIKGLRAYVKNNDTRSYKRYVHQSQASCNLLFPLSRILPLVAYYSHGGPWISCWVRLSYDPREHPESRV
jgi:hypothetical protein